MNTILYRFLHGAQAVQQQAEALIAFANEQRSPILLAGAIARRGWALAMQGQEEEGIQQIHQGMAADRAAGTELFRPYHLALLAEAYGNAGQIEEGLTALAEALDAVDSTGERMYEAELYRLKGELTLTQPSAQGLASSVHEEAEECFRKAIDIARKQQAKSLELRAVMSLVRLRQQQVREHATRNTQHQTRAMLNEAHQMLSEVYHWFTEGFDTKDLQEAKVLLEDLEGMAKWGNGETEKG
jgi:predicted ATPase